MPPSHPESQAPDADRAVPLPGHRVNGRVQYLGPAGSFSHLAARALLPGGEAAGKVHPGASVPACFDDLAHGRCTAIVVPVENGAKGYVGDTVEQLCARGADLAILGSAAVPVAFSLYRLAGDGGPLRSIASHPFGLAQVRAWSAARPLKEIETASTSGALEMLARERTTGLGAVAAPGIGDLYGLEEVETDLQGPSVNATRFLLVGRAPGEGAGADLAADPAAGGVGELYAGLIARDAAVLAPVLGLAVARGLTAAVAPAKQGPGFGGYRYLVELRGPAAVSPGMGAGIVRAAAALTGPGLVPLGVYRHLAGEPAASA
ncbi:MAG: hypothetical protein RLY86_3971 [Pseudomonadota bacterium]